MALILCDLILLGFPVGIFSGLFGVGGGVFLVPLFYSIFPTFTHKDVVATSLCTLFFNALLTNHHLRKKSHIANHHILLPMIFAIIISSLIGQRLLFILDTGFLKVFFSIVLILLAMQTLFLQNHFNNVENEKNHLSKKKKTLITTSSAVIAGIFGPMTGLGGGVIIVPTLMHFCKMKMKEIIPYSSFCIMASSLTSLIVLGPISPAKSAKLPSQFFSYFQWGHINFLIVACIIPGSYFGPILGLKIQEKIPEKTLKKIFACVLILLAVKILLKK